MGLPGPLLDLPTDGPADRVWQYFSTNGFYKIPIGNSTFDIPAVDDLRGGMNGFPDKASVEKLRYYGIRTVVLHLNDAQAARPRTATRTPSRPTRAAAAAKPVAGLGVTRRQVGSLRDLRDRPGPKALHGPTDERLATARRERRRPATAGAAASAPAPDRGARGAWRSPRSCSSGSPTRR